jgi:hypothetical protein
MIGGWRSAAVRPSEVLQTLAFRGRRSRNKVSVGEPAEGSLHSIGPTTANRCSVLGRATYPAPVPHGTDHRILPAGTGAGVVVLQPTRPHYQPDPLLTTPNTSRD